MCVRHVEVGLMLNITSCTASTGLLDCGSPPFYAEQHENANIYLFLHMLLQPFCIMIFTVSSNPELRDEGPLLLTVWLEMVDLTACVAQR